MPLRCDKAGVGVVVDDDGASPPDRDRTGHGTGQGFRLVLSAQDDLEVVGEAGDGDQAARLAATSPVATGLRDRVGTTVAPAGPDVSSEAPYRRQAGRVDG